MCFPFLASPSDERSLFNFIISIFYLIYIKEEINCLSYRTLIRKKNIKRKYTALFVFFKRLHNFLLKFSSIIKKLHKTKKKTPLW